MKKKIVGHVRFVRDRQKKLLIVEVMFLPACFVDMYHAVFTIGGGPDIICFSELIPVLSAHKTFSFWLKGCRVMLRERLCH